MFKKQTLSDGSKRYTFHFEIPVWVAVSVVAAIVAICYFAF